MPEILPYLLPVVRRLNHEDGLIQIQSKLLRQFLRCFFRKLVRVCIWLKLFVQFLSGT